MGGGGTWRGDRDQTSVRGGLASGVGLKSYVVRQWGQSLREGVDLRAGQ